MKIAVISPHLDDAAFSVAENMLSRPEDEFIIVCPMDGDPPNEQNPGKQATLRAEHLAVCVAAGWKLINGLFLDDAYGPQNEADLTAWLRMWVFGDWDQIWVPAGIHHPDHILVHVITMSLIYNEVQRQDSMLIYEELPYRVLYPNWYFIGGPGNPDRELQGYDPSNLQRKKELCRMYASQVDEQLERSLYVPERLWGLK